MKWQRVSIAIWFACAFLTTMGVFCGWLFIALGMAEAMPASVLLLVAVGAVALFPFALVTVTGKFPDLRAELERRSSGGGPV
jgi:hypothetical protein